MTDENDRNSRRYRGGRRRPRERRYGPGVVNTTNGSCVDGGGGTAAFGNWRPESSSNFNHRDSVIKSHHTTQTPLKNSNNATTRAQEPPERNTQRNSPGPTVYGTHAIGITRVASIARSPDLELMQDPSIIRCRAAELQNEVQQLECNGHAAIDNCAAPVAAWDNILSSFRVLTMTLTALGATENAAIRSMAILVYEAAADAALLAGNLSMYLPWQSRLLNDLYPRESEIALSPPSPSIKYLYPNRDPPSGATSTDLVAEFQRTSIRQSGVYPSRVHEFMGYSLLYSGAFLQNMLQTNCILRNLRPQDLMSPDVQFALRVVQSLMKLDYLTFCTLYTEGTSRQRTILYPVLLEVRKRAIRAIARSYRTLDTKVAADWLAITDQRELRDLLLAERPDLEPSNPLTRLQILSFVAKKSV